MDLNSSQTFSQIEMDSGASAGDYAHGYQVLVSNDGSELEWTARNRRGRLTGYQCDFCQSDGAIHSSNANG